MYFFLDTIFKRQLKKTNFVTEKNDGVELSMELEIFYNEALNCAKHLKLLESSPLLASQNSTQRKVALCY